MRVPAAMSYTLDDLKKAQEKLRMASDRAASSSSNNINFGQSDIHSAQDTVEIIIADLKRTGLLPKTAKEVLEDELDKEFPNARSKQIVEYKDRRYQLRFAPARMSRSRQTVKKWLRWWEEVKPEGD
jgi:hypothetical protein